MSLQGPKGTRCWVGSWELGRWIDVPYVEVIAVCGHDWLTQCRITCYHVKVYLISIPI